MRDSGRVLWVVVPAMIGALLSVWVFLTGYGTGSLTGSLVTTLFGLWPVAIVVVVAAVLLGRRPASAAMGRIAGAVGAFWIAFLIFGPLVYVILVSMIARGP